MKQKHRISASSISSSILGTYAGEVLDTNITNLNGLDIVYEVMDNVFKSDEYKQGIELGWFLGYLGHPDDPACQNFAEACIVMTEGHLEENGKVYGEFNLIDTPVGQIVKKFQDAGVKFGISIRGAGDIVGNEVDPETFVFRGFDLVSFPAYPESVPTFTAIAASTNLEDRRKYQAVCAAVKENINGVTSLQALDVIGAQFAKQSAEYRMIEERKVAITGAEAVSVDKEKIEAMTDLYLESQSKAAVLSAQLDKTKRELARVESTAQRKFKSVERIMGCQLNDVVRDRDSISASQSKLSKRVKKLNSAIQSQVREIDGLNVELDEVTAACRDLEKQNAVLASRLSKSNSQLKLVSDSNLIYKKKVESCTAIIQQKSDTISDLQSQLRKTVTAVRDYKVDTSNRDDINTELSSQIREYEQIICAYQDAYAQLYANVTGIGLNNLTVTASTTVSELKRLIAGAANTSNIPARPSYDAELVDVYEDDCTENSELVTM